MKRGAIIGFLLIIIGIGLFAYYDYFVKPEGAAREILVEAKMFFERGNNNSVNKAIDLFYKVVAKFPDTGVAFEGYYYIGRSYEKLGLNRLAYLKYIYILKTNRNIPGDFNREIRARIAKLRILRQRTEEGIHQLLGMLSYSTNREFRSRIYTELGHTYLKVGKYKDAKRMFNIAVSENGDNEEAILGKARAYKRMGQDNTAYDLYEYFLKYYGNFSHFTKDIRRSYLNQVYDSGYHSFKRGKYYNSISYFKRLVRFYPYSKKSESALYWIGECYFALEKYESAVSYFSKVLSNSFHNKDQDARIKKGYAYFMSKRFDLAAREFQIYINEYPNGKYFKTASKWKKMSSKEILYRIKNRMVPDDLEDDYDDEDYDDDDDDDGDDSESETDDDNDAHNEVETNYNTSTKKKSVKYENVAEL